MKKSIYQKLLSLLLCLSLIASYLPAGALRINAAQGDNYSTVADPATLTRPETIYGDNTANAGKITVGKSVSDQAVTVNGQSIAIDGENNFLVTISQSAQVMGLTSEINVPLDVVIVFDTSGSMGNDSNGNGKNRTQELVEAANKMIASLMGMNELNRVGVVAFSAHNAGGGTAGYDAANVLSELAHYEGQAASQHLTWTTGAGPSWAPTVQLVQGRSTTDGKTNSRYGTGGATNIQAGVTLGAELLMEADTTVDINGQTITRTPILILMSDGAPTVSAYENQWWNASQTNNQGPTNAPFMGNGFLTVLTASYYKNEITKHYYGANAGENACSFYTVGVELSDAATQDTQQEVDLSYMTLNPKEEFVAGSDNYYYDRNTAADSFLDAWNSYRSGQEFSVRVWADQSRHDGYYYFYNTQKTLQNANDYKNGADTWTTVGRTTVQPNILDSVTTLHYNDKFYNVTDVSQLTEALDEMLTEIARKAITVPTKVTTGDHDFDGYVNFYDPIGEYMEVKDMKGVLADGYFYQGASFAQKLSRYGTASADAAFDALLHSVIKTRMGLSEADSGFASEEALDQFIHDLLVNAQQSENQANYTDANNYDNSFVWWGNAYNSGEEDEHVQLVAFAENDTIEYITDESTNIPAGADYVCRSYFFYGEAGGANPNPDHEYLYFVVRVQRELTAPYRQTVVISAPASLLSMEKVLITETFDENGQPVYTATVEEQMPARVVYEVGLWDTITPKTVSGIVSADYTAEAVEGEGSVNYDAATDTYYFFTNDWDRTQSLESHHRGLAKATFDAAEDNAFYTYQRDTLLVDANGNAVTSNPAGKTVYYVREYYDWTNVRANADGTYNAVKTSKLIEVDVPADTQLLQIDGKWYIPAGVYTSATLQVNGDDTLKESNLTGTSSIVAHPHRTGEANNSHYTVLLGNNGKLGLTAETPEPVKTVSVNLPEDATKIVDDEGKAVQVGDVLTYTVEARNHLNTAADITVTDYIPMGTDFVPGSAGVGTAQTGHTKDASIQPDSNNVLTWVLEDVPAGETRYVSFQVTVTAAALSLSVVPNTIENTATVQLNNLFSFDTNTTHNPPYGKSVTDVNNRDIHGEHGFKVGDVLVYHIRFHNNARNSEGDYVAADVTVTDQIPAGTTFLSADNDGSFNAETGIVTWKFENMTANTAKVVSFQVQINASAKAQSGQADGVEPATGEIYLPNTATIQIDSNPDVVLETNQTENWADLGDMQLTKLVAAGGDQTKIFTLNLTESSGLLDGKYTLTGGDAAYVEFDAGKASVSIKHGQALTIQGLPAGVIISVEEDVSQLPGWTPTYNTQSVTIVKGAATTVSSVSVTNTYGLEPLTLTLKGVKNMSGTALPDDLTFGFLAMPDSANPEIGDPLTGEVTVTGNGAFSFTMSPKTFNKPGVYKYTISEINGGVLGVSYDNKVYTLMINVMDNGDGTMSATATLDNAAFNMDADAVTFDNTYTPDDMSLEFTADKTLSGRQMTPGEFRFRITDGTDTYEGINDADGNIIFESIHYTAAGTYTYQLSEVIPGNKAEGISYDTKTYQILVMVQDVNGQLVPTVTVDGADKTVNNGIVDTGVTFRNSFVPDDVPLNLTAKKTLMVYNAAQNSHVATAPEAGKFRFQIVDDSGNTVAIGSNDAQGNVSFETIYFSADMLKDVSAVGGSKTKTFHYTIYEVVPELAKDSNMKYDLDGREITVTLTQSANGTLTVSVGGDTDGMVDLTGTVNFVNYSNPGSVSVTPTGKKTTNGENLPEDLSFSFKVLPVGGTVDAATGTSDATQGGGNSQTTDITFTSMVYTRESLGGAASKTFDYWIMESNAKASGATGSNGVTYDTTRYLYRVILSEDATTGRLIATEQYFKLRDGGDKENAADYTLQISGANVSFTNTYAAKTHINLTAAKKLTGRDAKLAANEFDFVLQRLDASGKIVDASHITGTNDANGVIHFATLNYSNEMLDEAYKHTDGAYYFSYLLSEIKPEGVAVPGVTYDTTQYVVTIQVTQDSDNAMTAKLAGVSKAVRSGDSYRPGQAVAGFTAAGSTNVTFNNVYTTTEGDVVAYKIKKELNGRTIRAGEFEFGLFLNGEQVDVATNDENGIVTFSREIPATAGAHAGIYKMVIKEFVGSQAGVTYSTQEYPIYVKIADNGKGKIEATVHLTEDGPALAEDATGLVDLTQEILFVNTYEAHDTTYTPTARKELTGRTQLPGEFSFQAQLIHDGQPVVNGTIYKGINNAAGSVLFETITFTETGTYLYKLSELQGSATGVAYDTKAFYLKVTVADDGSGHLKTTAGYYADEACTQTVANVVFKNTYTPASVPVQLQGNKTMNGRKLVDKEFSFLVYGEGSSDPIASGNNDANGNISFSTFNITAEDMSDGNGGYVASRTFSYTIVESNNNLPGVTYAEPVQVTVTVTNTNGILSAQVNYPQGTAAEFVNSYDPGQLELPLVAFKNLLGKNLKAEAFILQLKDASGKVIQSVKNDADGVIRFENLKFTQAGTYTYTVSEKNESVQGVSYDDSVYTITVVVTDDLRGNLTAEASYTDENRNPVQLLQFTNTYTPAAIELDLNGIKTIVDAEGNALTGENYSLAGFEFEVRDTNGALVATDTSDDQGNITFTGFTFTTAGEYRYLINEKATDRAGYTTDSTIWCVHVTIGYNADTGELYEAEEYVHLAPETHEELAVQAEQALEFVNVYDPADVSLTLKAMKKLEGRELKEHEFTFYMVDKATNLRVAESRNHANGEVVFSLNYSKAGVYNYSIYEMIPDIKADGVTYSTQTYDVTVTVTDNGDGALNIQVGGITTTGAATLDLTSTHVFRNTYTPGATDVTIEAFKRLDGRTLNPGEFRFQLVNVKDPEDKKIATNAGDGKVTFDPITYTKAGVYQYVLSEIVQDAGGVTYDTNEYGVKVQVTDDGAGKLHAVVHYERGAEATEAVPVFHNLYKPEPVDYTVTAKKRFEGDQMRTFDFVLEGDGFQTQTKQNDENGDVRFDKLTFTAAGTYTFTVSEQINDSWDDIKWDTNVYTLNIEVIDEGKGQLEIRQVTVTSDLGKNDLTFRNVHNDIITKKDVFSAENTAISIDGEQVKKGDILSYTISYTNYTGKPADITITDAIPQYTSYVTGSADKGAGYDNGILTWNLTGIAADATVTVSFKVEVTGTNVTIENQGTVLEGENSYDTNIVTNDVPEDKVVKDVFHVAEPTVSIDGDVVQKNDILLYKVTYTNSFEAAADVTITDTIPQYTSYVEGSADNGGTYSDGVLTWNVHLAAGESKTVTFQVKVDETNITVVNQASALEGNNRLDTNIVTNPVPEDKIVKDVFHVAEPTVSIDGNVVQKDDILLYKVTYANSYEAAAEVTITDTIPQYTSYVEGSADNGGIFADGKLTWNVHLAASESITVTFQVKVDETNITVVNQASALEGENKLDTNIVTNPVPEDKVVKDVFHVAEPTVSIDGQIVEKNDILLYKITYTNSFEAAANVTITDTIPQYTSYVNGSADNGGTCNNGVVTWNVRLAPGESITVTFQVKVNETNITVVNQASALEGTNQLDTNVVTNPVPEDKILKDVFHVAEPTVSIDGQAVEKNDILLYKITYINSNEAAADVIITDTIPQYTSYVEGSADNGGIYADGKLTWNVHLEASESITVTFQVKVDEAYITVVNQASALEGENKLDTNTVTNPVEEDILVKDVFLVDAPTVSVDGKRVQVGDLLLYTITYGNDYGKDIDLQITDGIPAHTSYVEGSADNGGIFADGKLTWNVHLEAGESVTVTFKVKVNDMSATIKNQAKSFDGVNTLESNVVTNTTPNPIPDTGDSTNAGLLMGTMSFSALGMVILLAVLVLDHKKNKFER